MITSKIDAIKKVRQFCQDEFGATASLLTSKNLIESVIEGFAFEANQDFYTFLTKHGERAAIEAIRTKLGERRYVVSIYPKSETPSY